MISLWGKRRKFSLLTGREQFRRIAYKLIAAQAFVEIAEDGKLTKDDLEPAARGLASAALLYLEKPVLQYMAKRGIFLTANAVSNWLTAFYLGGLTASYAIDSEEGISNYNDFVFTAIQPWESNNLQVTQDRAVFTIGIIFFNDWKGQAQIEAEQRVEDRGGGEAGIFVDDELDFGFFDSFLRALA
jgi:hypothetical protein